MDSCTYKFHDITYTFQLGLVDDGHGVMEDAVRITAADGTNMINGTNTTWSRCFSTQDALFTFCDQPIRIHPREMFELLQALSDGIAPIGCEITFPDQPEPSDDLRIAFKLNHVDDPTLTATFGMRIYKDNLQTPRGMIGGMEFQLFNPQPIAV